jgi:hypothetical protein
MNRDITCGLITGPKNTFEKNHPVQVYGIGAPGQRFSLTFREASDLAQALIGAVAIAVETQNPIVHYPIT